VTPPDVNGVVTVTGAKAGATPNALVTVWNETKADACKSACPDTEALGVVAEVHQDGSWGTQIAASSKDRLLVWQTIGNDSSNAREVVVP
jgi:hypothetical protein